MATAAFQDNSTPSTNEENSNQGKVETIAQRLACRERLFVEGDSNSSERYRRKQVAHRQVNQRHQSRFAIITSTL